MRRENALIRNLLDAGCSGSSAAFVDQLVQTGRLADALHEMKVIRCDLMDELHQSQRRVLSRLPHQENRKRNQSRIERRYSS